MGATWACQGQCIAPLFLALIWSSLDLLCHKWSALLLHKHLSKTSFFSCIPK
uniref:Uncharacterized protein n=1 Tax=Physcomitrium patens TaxID=3218 RepID=A0A2K1KPX5_PHYPA|nr:hypothetical protein PHYPA_006693 [Physcomitrium patens]